MDSETPLVMLRLSARPFRILSEHGIETLGDLCALTFIDLTRMPGLGQKSVREIQQSLEVRGLSLTKYEVPASAFMEPVLLWTTTVDPKQMLRELEDHLSALRSQLAEKAMK